MAPTWHTPSPPARPRRLRRCMWALLMGRIVLAHYLCRTRAATTCWVSAHTLRYARDVLALTLSLSWCAVFVAFFLCRPLDTAHLTCILYTSFICQVQLIPRVTMEAAHNGANGTVRIHPTSLSPHAPHALLFLSLFPKSNKSSPTTRAPWRRLSWSRTPS